MKDCCGEDVLGPPTAVPAATCSDWQDAWGELHDFGASIRPYLKRLEDVIEDCTGDWIRGSVPKPRRRTLPAGDDASQLRAACRRARNYMRRLQRWGARLADVHNEHCDDDGLPTHLKDPPDPPF